MSQTLPEHVINRSVIDLKLAGARYQIGALRGSTASANASTGAESSAAAAIDQMIQAVIATLQGLNMQLPEPLPASRVSLRNLRDEFRSVQAESAALRAIEQVHRAGGWLHQLEQQRLGSTFAPLLSHTGGSYQIYCDPLEPGAGTESQSAVDYLEQMLNRVQGLVRQTADQMPEDVVRFREAQRKQARRLI